MGSEGKPPAAKSLKSWAQRYLNLGFVAGFLLVLLTYIVVSQQFAMSPPNAVTKMAPRMEQKETIKAPGETGMQEEASDHQNDTSGGSNQDQEKKKKKKQQPERGWQPKEDASGAVTTEESPKRDGTVAKPFENGKVVCNTDGPFSDTCPAVHDHARRAGGAVRARRPDRQLLARLQRHAGAAVRGVAQHPAVVARQVRGHRAAAVQVRRRRSRPRRPGPVLPARHRGAPNTQGVQRRAGVGPRRPPLHGRLHPVRPRDVRAAARRAGQPEAAAAESGGEEAAAAADPTEPLPQVRERAGDRDGGGEGGVRGGGDGPAVRRAGGGAGPRGELLRRAAGGAQRRADERGVPAGGRGGDPGGAVREAGADGEGGLRRPGGGHGNAVPRVQHRGGGEHAAGDARAGAPGDQGPGVGAPERLGQGRRVLPR